MPKSPYLLNRWSELIEASRFQRDQAAFHAAHVRLHDNASTRLCDLGNPRFPNGNICFNKFNDTQRLQALMARNNFVLGRAKKKERFAEHDLWRPSEASLGMERMRR